MSTPYQSDNDNIAGFGAFAQADQPSAGWKGIDLRKASPIETEADGPPTQAANEGDGRTMLAARDLSFYYGTTRALAGVSIEIPEKKITALIGPSGCGKSTFLRVFNRMNDEIDGTRTEGEVFVEGYDIHAPEVDVCELRKKVGMVFQRANPFPKSIFENVVYGARIHGEKSRARLTEIAEESLRHAVLWDEVKDSLHKSAFELSGGQQQRLCIARVLAVQPHILLMDEPTSALDPNATFRIEDLMNELRKNYTVVVVTHNMQQAARVSDMTGFFLNGELIEFGETGKIFTKPDDVRTEDYISGRFG